MKFNTILFIAILSVSVSFGQKRLADKFFKNYAYIKATELYQKAYDKGDDSKHVLTRLGDCYYNNSNVSEAAKWYNLALEKYGDIESEYIYKFIQTQRSLGKFDEASRWLQILNKRQSSDSRFYVSGDKLTIYNELSSTDETYVIVKNLNINSEYSDFGSTIYDNTFYFASTRNQEGKKYKWNDQPFLDLYETTFTRKDSLITFSGAKLLNASNINSDLHEASIAITNDGTTMYFTRDNVNKKNRANYDKEGTNHLKIYRATKVNGSWENIEELSINDDVFSTGHPALSPDNKNLYFVSDREGGIGATDIYVVTINEDGSLGEPENLGADINTEGREMFPFVAKDSTLYFSSDGHLNIGLLDIFKSNYLKTGETEVINLGAPYNSGKDDFAFFINSDSRKGFFSSNRENGKGDDDIYSFEQYTCTQMITGVVYNDETLSPIEGAVVQKIDATGKVLEEQTTDASGSYSFIIDCDEEYTILGRKEDYKDDTKVIATNADPDREYQADLHLIPLIRNDQIVINPIFFDFDKWNIRTDAQYELENIVDVLREHPKMVIKIESHTDSRGSNRYNRKLSDRRAKSTRDYLLSRGIAPERIESAIGYGENQLINECEDGVRCSEEKHQENRRSYFYILKY